MAGDVSARARDIISATAEADAKAAAPAATAQLKIYINVQGYHLHALHWRLLAALRLAMRADRGGSKGQLAHTHMPAHRGKYAQIMAQLNRHFWAANVTVRGATRRDTGRVEGVWRGKCARRGWRTTYVGVRALFAAAAARCKWHVVNFAAGRRTVDSGPRTLDVEFVVLTPAATVPEFQRCHRGAKRCCIAAAANVTPDSGQNCAGHCWLTTNTNTMLHTVANTHTTAQTQRVRPVLRASA